VDRFSYRAALPWIGLAAILTLYVAFIIWLRPTNLFGLQQDDSVYFSSAKAIAQGRGYVLPSVPGEPSAAYRYPILYPWMLSLVWRWNPSFPSNLSDAVGLSVGFGVLYVVFVFIFFRKSMSMGDAEACFLTAFCALNPIVLFCSVTVISDMAFAAFSLGALVIADSATKPNGSRWLAIACGILAGLSILTRTTGYPIVFGILIVALLRKAWRPAILFIATVAIFFALYVWEKVSAARVILPPGWATVSPGFRQTWLYYTDYVGFRRLSMATPRMVVEVFFSQLSYLFRQIPGYFLSTSFVDHMILTFLLTMALLWLVSAGFVRSIRTDGWKPIHVALILYVGIVLAWNYPSWDRYLIPFLPLFAGAFWIEWKWIYGELSYATRSGLPHGTRVAALLGMFALLTIGGILSWTFVANSDRDILRETSRRRASLLIEKREAYDWLQKNSPPGDRVIAAEDICLYLYTGRQSMTAITMLPFGIYEPKQMEADLDHMTDVATEIKAAYWLGSSDDNDQQWTQAQPKLTARENQIESALPELFRSSSGSVRIYGLSCPQSPAAPSCLASESVLFPPGYSPTDQRVDKLTGIQQ
jgi:4-amino-4-deoxy-L-arabinose transferase-like glycosyltransferase